jgi:hypothetical protein
VLGAVRLGHVGIVVWGIYIVHNVMVTEQTDMRDTRGPKLIARNDMVVAGSLWQWYEHPERGVMKYQGPPGILTRVLA